MLLKTLVPGTAALLLCLAGSALQAQGDKAAPAAAPAQPAAAPAAPAAPAAAPDGDEGPAMSPETEAVLRKSTDYMKKITTRVFRVTDTIDDVSEDGQKIQYAHLRKFTVKRPDKLKVEVTGDVTNRTLWIDGKNITIYDKDANIYAQVPAPGTLDEAIDVLEGKYGMNLPASDLLADDAYASLTENADEVEYIGTGLVGEEKCHHLAFLGDTIDYQIWFSQGENPGPRKEVITYKELPGEPQYTLQLLSHEDSPKLDDATFTPDIPKDATKVEAQPVGPAD